MSLLLAVTDPAAHPSLLTSDLAATFPTTTTGHAFSSTGVGLRREAPHPARDSESLGFYSNRTGGSSGPALRFRLWV